MDMDKAIVLTEKYLREFILFLMSFFVRSAASENEDSKYDDLNKSMVFSVLSAVLGSYLWNRYILRLSGKQADLIGLLTDNILRWASLGLVLFLLFRVLQARVPIIAPVLSVLKVFSVSHVVSIYAAYIVVSVLAVFVSEAEFQTAQHNAFMTAYGLQLAMLWAYVPREVKAIAPVATAVWKRWTITVAFLLLASSVVVIKLATYQFDLNNPAATEEVVSTGQ